MRTLTPDLWAILADKLQIGDSGHRARLEVGTASPGTLVDDPWVVTHTLVSFGATIAADGSRMHYAYSGSGNAGFVITHATRAAFDVWTSDFTVETLLKWDANSLDASHDADVGGVPVAGEYVLAVGSVPNSDHSFMVQLQYGPTLTLQVSGVYPGTSDSLADLTLTPDTLYHLKWEHTYGGTSQAKIWADGDSEPSWMVSRDASGDVAPDGTDICQYVAWTAGGVARANEMWADDLTFNSSQTYDNWNRTTIANDLGTPSSLSSGGTSTSFTWASYQVESASVDKSYGTDADSMTVALPNQDGAFNALGDTPLVSHDTPVRLYQWYGDPLNEVLTFTGLGNAITDHREPHTVTIRALDRMKLLLDESFISVTAPQGATDAGAVRTPANGVWVGYEALAIANDLLDMAGWPADKRDLTATNHIVDEFIVSLNDSYAGALRRVWNIVVYEPSVDEDGVYQAHPRPSVLTGVDTDTPVSPVASFSGTNEVTVLDAGLDDQGLKTRVLVFGPAATAPQETWNEIWRTSVIAHPNGEWLKPSEPTKLYVIDGHTRKVYKLDQATRTIDSASPALSSNSLSGGLDGDDPDSETYIWVLETPWRNVADDLSASSDPTKLRKVRVSDWTTVDSQTYVRHFVSVKGETGYIWLADYTNQKLFKYAKSDLATVVTTVSLDFAPTGIAIDEGLGQMWIFGGGSIHVRALSDLTTDVTTHDEPGSVGGGEIDPDDTTYIYAGFQDTRTVYKYQLEIPGTPAVGGSAIDYNLEDAIGARAGVEPRVHAGCPNDADPHPFQVRLETLTDDKLTNSTQAQDTANRLLAQLSRRRRNVQIGIVANPGIQKGDPVSVNDPPSGLVDQLIMVETYNTNQDGGAYMGVISGPLWIVVPSMTPPLDSLSEGFEGTSYDNTVAGWTRVNNSYPKNMTAPYWYIVGGSDWFHTGAQAVSDDFNTGTGVATNSDWLITPELNLTDGGVLTFWTKCHVDAYPSRMKVHMSTAGAGASVDVGTAPTDEGDFTDVLLDINPTYARTDLAEAGCYPANWTQYTITLTGLPGGAATGRFAFHYFVEDGGPGGSRGSVIYLDDVHYG